ncbi:LOW QUALITY PROTEIN: putative alpha crystallin A chain [Contains: Alpha crystallin A chain, short form] [Schistosoma mansoni]|nr:LOW QUALITY PROTEIN: putative alpha crystallin A chain [Contains: Alpha crystallin A chain, short form] [Schistosoma mansoni]|eukprot:XP_018649075.1 LOW QUALITY PROTEIN: putative alpha crystallin A chain [Contains: Alpha crystallin A chain, short form] [Schistosoma mansoni]
MDPINWRLNRAYMTIYSYISIVINYHSVEVWIYLPIIILNEKMRQSE